MVQCGKYMYRKGRYAKAECFGDLLELKYEIYFFSPHDYRREPFPQYFEETSFYDDYGNCHFDWKQISEEEAKKCGMPITSKTKNRKYKIYDDYDGTIFAVCEDMEEVSHYLELIKFYWYSKCDIRVEEIKKDEEAC
jgi:hypothetical protein